MSAAIRNSIQALKDEIVDIRRAMHENPQTAYEETFASDLVASKLTEWGIPFEREIAVTGIVATIEGEQNTSGKAVGLRADMDALDIEEADNKAHTSKNPGKMHACGHDGHTAMLLGAAKYLSENRNFDGKVHLIFQPAEEGCGGAHRMIEDGLFDRFPCDSIYGVHNRPYLKRGVIATCVGPIMASVDTFKMTIKGRGGHAAYPHKAIDPIVIGAQIINSLQTLVSRTPDPMDPVVLSITNFNAGTGAHSIIPDEGHIIGTLRSYNHDLRKDLSARIGTLAAAIAEGMGASIDYEYDFIIDPTINDADATARCVNIARGIVGDDNVDDRKPASMAGEDFGRMLMEVPGCYVWLGQGEEDASSNHNQGLHTPRYDFNDEIIPLGVEYWVKIVEKTLPPKK